jgi:molybdate transport system ATP-binding protein
MLIRTLAAGAALAMLVSGAASAAPQAKASAVVASPKQPIPYGQLEAYLKASPKARASTDWWSGSASTGMSTDTSATAPATDTSASSSTSTESSVNPPAASTLPSDSSTSMPATPPTMPESTTPAPGSNLPGSTTTPGAPTEPK